MRALLRLLLTGLAIEQPLLAAHREFVRFAVRRLKTCPVFGIPLEPANTVVVDLSDGLQQVLTVSGDAFDQFIEPRISSHQEAGVRVEVFDGRLLFSLLEKEQEKGWEVYPPLDTGD